MACFLFVYFVFTWSFVFLLVHPEFTELVENADKAMSIVGNYSDPFDLGSPISVA